MSGEFFDAGEWQNLHERADEKSVSELMLEGQDLLRRVDAMENAMKLGKLMEPHDRSLGQSEEVERGNAFYRGFIAGIGIGRRLAGNDRQLNDLGERLRSIEVPGVDVSSEDELEIMYQLAETVLGRGRTAIRENPELGELLETEFLDHVESQVAHQYYAKSGVGLGYELILTHIREKSGSKRTPPTLTEDAIGQVDWDNELEELLADE